MTIPLAKPLIEAEEIEAASEALKMGFLGMGSYVGEFENKLSQYLGLADRYLAMVSTGTDAIHLSLRAAGVKAGDEVIAPSLNFISDIQAILAVGAEPVICDVIEDSVCIDLDKAELLITPKTKAIIIMDYSCRLCDYEKLERLTQKYPVRVIHDAAHSFGSTWKSKKIGTFSDICVFSFDPIKTITCIDGGAIIVRTEKEKEHIHSLRQLGMPVSPNVQYQNKKKFSYDISEIGFRNHMPNLHAAIGLAQLKKVDAIAQKKQKVCRYYNEMLTDIDGLMVPQSDFRDIVPFMYYLRILENRRDAFRGHLQQEGISTGLHWVPNHRMSLLKDCRRSDISISEKLGGELVTIPMYTEITKDEQDKVIFAIQSFFKSQVALS